MPRQTIWQSNPELAQSLTKQAQEKKSVVYALGERPEQANGKLREATIDNGSIPSYGKDAWKSVEGYMPSCAKQASDSDKKDQQGPPNYRAGDPGGPNCRGCKYFDLQSSICQKYATQVQPEMVCDEFEPASASLKPEGGGPDFSSLAKPVGPAAPLSPGQQFKFGFLYRCAEQGLTIDETCAYAEKLAQALESSTEKTADFGLSGMILPAALLAAAPFAMGGTILADALHRRRLAEIQEFRNKNKVDVQDFQNLELINEYKNQTKQIRKSLANRQQLGAPSTPALKY